MIYDNWFDAQTARVAAWEGDVKFPLEFYVCELLGEVGEAANVIKKLDREAGGAPGSRDTTQHLAEELADSLICLRNVIVKYCGENGLSYRLLPTVMAGYQRFKTGSDYSVAMGKGVGNIFSKIFYGSGWPMMFDSFSALEGALRLTADFYKIDLDKVMVDKWNATSEKVGLPHRMQLHHTLEETFK